MEGVSLPVYQRPSPLTNMRRVLGLWNAVSVTLTRHLAFAKRAQFLGPTLAINFWFRHGNTKFFGLPLGKQAEEEKIMA